MSGGSSSLYAMVFFELSPNYLCKNEISEWESCHKEEFCGTDIEYKVNWDSTYSLFNWVEEYDLHCAGKSTFGMFGSMYFLGVVIFSMITPPLADKIGRKKVLVVSSILQLIAMIIQISSRSLSLTYACAFLMGVSMPGRVFVGFHWACEFMPAKRTPLATVFILGTDNLVLAVAALYFRYVNVDWKILQICFCCSLSVGILLTMLYFPESPKYVHNMKRYADARAIIATIAKKNNMQEIS